MWQIPFQKTIPKSAPFLWVVYGPSPNGIRNLLQWSPNTKEMSTRLPQTMLWKQSHLWTGQLPFKGNSKRVCFEAPAHWVWWFAHEHPLTWFFSLQRLHSAVRTARTRARPAVRHQNSSSPHPTGPRSAIGAWDSPPTVPCWKHVPHSVTCRT